MIKTMFALIGITAIFISLFPNKAFAEDFGPWDSQIKTGDALIVSQHKHNHAISHASAYGGVQGGAYIMIRFYQVFISPQDGPACRYSPTCSRYGRSAVERYGAFLGALLAGDRILRCNPYNPPGSDPVPSSLSYE